ncbi:MAG: hypothetical protein IJB47_00985 [Oscillospiraceae bacterium]|nr:hypothetical protein [Oscillospiraceae bacterium]
MELAKAKDIAVGVITCAQGASIIESWVPAGTFEKSGIEIPFQQAHPEEDLSSLFKWNIAGLLYEQAFLQVVPFSVSAVVWYQGESDTYLQEAKVYKQELAVLIDTWRTDLDNRNLPFIIIQLADYQSTLNSEGWKLVQQAQLDIQQERDNVMSVVCADVCETDNIHPPTKDKLSKRVAAAIESFVLNN